MTTPERTPWVERRFVFDLPVSMFPSLLERLRGTPARVEDRIRGLDRAALTRTAGGWSIQTTVGHLISLEALWIGRVDDFAVGRDVLRPADMTNRHTEEADYDAADIADLTARFREERDAFVAALEAMSEAEIARTARHPRLDQPMRVLDLMVFAAEHDDHHLATVTTLLAAP